MEKKIPISQQALAAMRRPNDMSWVIHEMINSELNVARRKFPTKNNFLDEFNNKADNIDYLIVHGRTNDREILLKNVLAAIVLAVRMLEEGDKDYNIPSFLALPHSSALDALVAEIKDKP